MRGYRDHLPEPIYEKIYTGRHRQLKVRGSRFKVQAGKRGVHKTIRTNKVNRYITRKEFAGAVLNKAFWYIIRKVICYNNAFDDCGITIRIKEIKKPGKALKAFKIDSLRTGFSFYYIDFRMNGKPFHLDIDYYSIGTLINRVYENKITDYPEKTLSLVDLTEALGKKYKDLTKTKIRNILRTGFSRIKKALRSDCELGFFRRNIRDSTFMSIYITNKKERTPDVKGSAKYRFLYRLHEEEYSGYYYTCLNDAQFNTFNKKCRYTKLYLSLDEAKYFSFLERKPHIIRVKITKPLYQLYTITLCLSYEKDRTEYIWRRSGTRFESVDNSQFRFDLLSEWNYNNI